MNREEFFEWLQTGPKFDVVCDDFGTTTVKFDYEEPDDLEEENGSILD